MVLSEVKSFPLNVEVTGFHGAAVLIERLHEIGLHKGCKLVVLGQAPLKGPLLVEFQTTVLALRDEESACLEIQSL
jgi:Fe2+ transport system protein FeoA